MRIECTKCGKLVEGTSLVYLGDIYHKHCGEEVKNEAEGFVKCKKCSGTGKHEYMDEGSWAYQIDGRGTPPQFHSDKCSECNGEGRIKGKYIIETKTVLKRD